MGRRGPKPSGSQPISIRLRPELRAKLDQIADHTGRPLAEIINKRLDHSLSDEMEIERRFGDRETYRVLQVVAMAIDQAQSSEHGKWLHDADTFDRVVAAITRTLAAIRPAEAHDPGATTSHAYRAGAEIARSVWRTIAAANSERPLDRARKINEDLNAIIPRATVHREEFHARARTRHIELLNDTRADNRPPAEASEAEWSEWGRLRGALLSRAEQEVEAEMIAEGKNPQLDREDTF